MAHLLDAAHCVLFSGMASAFQTFEFDLNLPCEESLWQAPSAKEWYATLDTPSPFTYRLAGVPCWQALATLQQPISSDQPPSDVLLLNKFSLFILLKVAILRRLYARLHIKYGGNVYHVTDGYKCEAFLAEFGLMLQNWMLMWMRNAGSTQLRKCDGGGEEVPFVFDALPYYWLAQVTLWSLRSKNAGSIGKMTQQNRFFVVNEWLRRIRVFLKTNNIPPDLWHEFMVIYQQVGDVEFRFSFGFSSGLVSFFQE